MSKTIDQTDKLERIVELATLPLTTSDCFRYLGAHSQKEKSEVTSSLEKLASKGTINYTPHLGLKDRVVETPLKNDDLIEFTGTSYSVNEIQIFVGVGDLFDISRVATISRLRGDSGGFQRTKETSWVHELATAFSKRTPPLLFTSIVLYFDKASITLANGKIQVPLTREQGPTGWIIDGQQRCYAAQESRLRALQKQPMPCPLVVIIGDKGLLNETDFLRTLFINANNTRPLPKNLVDQLVGLLSDPTGAALTEKRKKAFEPQQILRDLDQDEDSPVQNLLAFDDKTSSADCCYNLTVASRNVQYVLNTIKRNSLPNADPKQLFKDILSAIKKTWPEVFLEILRDPRAVSPILVFLADNLSSMPIYSAPNRVERLIATLLPLKPYLHLVKSDKDWEEGGDWNPTKTARTSKDIVQTARLMKEIYARVVLSNPTP